jgi:hypothetical protein
MSVNLIRDVAKVCSRNCLLTNPKQKTSLLAAAKPSGFLGYLGALGEFLEKCFGKSSADARRREIRYISNILFINLPPYAQINQDSDEKILFSHPSAGYQIKQKGIKVFICTKDDVKLKVENNLVLIELDTEAKYQEFKRGLISLLPEFKLADYYYSIKDNARKKEKFTEVSEVNIDFTKPINQLKLDEQLEIVKFCLRYDEKLAHNILANFSPTTLSEIAEVYSKYAPSSSDDARVANLRIFYKGIDKLLNGEPSTYLKNLHNKHSSLLKSAFEEKEEKNKNNGKKEEINLTVANIYATLQQAKLEASYTEVFKIMEIIHDIAYSTLNFDLFRTKSLAELASNTSKINAPKVLYTNLAKEYQIVQEGAQIFLYTGRPFTLFNSKLKKEIITFSSEKHLAKLVTAIGTNIGKFETDLELLESLNTLENAKSQWHARRKKLVAHPHPTLPTFKPTSRESNSQIKTFR